MIPRKAHAVLDAASVVALLVGPDLARWPVRLRRRVAIAGLGVAGYSLLTRYEDDGRVPLSMREHLAMDALQGATFCVAAVRARDPRIGRALGAYGAFSLAAALLTERGPRRAPVPRQVPLSRDAVLRSMRGERVHAIANDVAWRRLAMVNVVLLGSPDAGDRGWVLVDAGLPGSGGFIEAAAAERFGAGARPSAIVMTHGHFDHVGALRQLADKWDAPIFAHPAEYPYLTGEAAYPPGDPTIGGGAMAALAGLYPTEPIEVSDRLSPLPEDGTVPGAPEWRWVHTPGHSPGHVSLWRGRDRILIAGDAVITTRQESALAVAWQWPEVHGPPAYFTTEWDRAGTSVWRLSQLEPEVLIAGHGAPMAGTEMRDALHRLSLEFDRLAVPRGGRYLRSPARPGRGA